MSTEPSHRIIKARNQSCTLAILLKEFYNRRGFWSTLEEC